MTEASAAALVTEPVPGGALVWRDAGSRELVGVSRVTDMVALRAELAQRGIPTERIHELEVYEPGEVSR